LLANLLAELEAQESSGLFTHSAVVIDNDAEGSARETVDKFVRRSNMTVVYDVEPEQNISLARNRAVRDSTGDYIAFFDDDQSPGRDWLHTLYTAQKEFQADGILGPVKPVYDEDPPRWVVKGGFYERPTHATGMVIGWRNGRTGNVLLKRELFAGDPQPFDPMFGSGGEDQDFFRRMIGKGHRFVWCNEAVGYEHIPPLRWRRGFLLRRALLRGKMSLRHPGMGMKSILVSLTAMPVYLALLPLLAIMGHHLFMRYLVKICDHLGRILTAARINVIQEKYVVE
jgi:glycosyltransferase involved in cell wall biosynthesis